MVDDDEVKRHSWLTWERVKDVIAVLTPFAVGLLGGVQLYLDARQDELNQELATQKASLEQRVSRTKLIDDMLTNIEQYLDKSSLPDPAKARIIISLLKISTDAYLAKASSIRSRKDLSERFPSTLLCSRIMMICSPISGPRKGRSRCGSRSRVGPAIKTSR